MIRLARRHRNEVSACAKRTHGTRSNTAPRRSRKGFALFMALGALVIIGVLVAASSFISLQETRLGQNALVQSKAFAVAEYGLNRIQADWDKTPNLKMLNGQSFDTSYALAGQGTCNVRYTRLNTETFWIVSEGRASVGNSMSGSRVAVKRVGAVLRLRIPTIKAEGAITAGGNVTLKGSASVDGTNATPPGWSSDCAGVSGTNKAGIIVPNDGSKVTLQGSATVSGSPAWKSDPLAANQNTYIRYGDETWTTLTAQANVTIPTGTYNSDIAPTTASGACNKGNQFNWGEPWRVDPLNSAKDDSPTTEVVQECYNYFPIIYATGSITLNGNGRGQGILLVNGDIRINGGFEWHGLIVVSNDIVRGSGHAQVFGGVMARNEILADDSEVSGSANYNYSACALERAMLGSASVVQAKERAWTELY